MAERFLLESPILTEVLRTHENPVAYLQKITKAITQNYSIPIKLNSTNSEVTIKLNAYHDSLLDHCAKELVRAFFENNISELLSENSGSKIVLTLSLTPLADYTVFEINLNFNHVRNCSNG